MSGGLRRLCLETAGDVAIGRVHRLPTVSNPSSHWPDEGDGHLPASRLDGRAIMRFASQRGARMAGKFELYTNAGGRFRFRVKAANGEIIASSSEACDAKRVPSAGSSQFAPTRLTSLSTTRPSRVRTGR